MKPLIRRSMLLALAAVACAAPPRLGSRPSDWASTLLRDHPMAGRIWSTREARWIDRAELDRALSGVDVLLLGETHDNADHHRLQAEILEAWVSRGRRPAVAFEMIDAAQQPIVDATGSSSPEALAAALKWDESGWPPFALYRPIFEVVARHGLQVAGADLSNEEVRAMTRDRVLPGDVRTEIEAATLTPEETESWREEMRAVHCGMLPERALGPMVQAQRARDLRLAKRVAAASDGGVALIAGAGHVRRDRAVPLWLSRIAPGLRIGTVSMVELRADTDPAKEALPYDFALFTPRADRPDPCEAFHRPPKGVP